MAAQASYQRTEEGEMGTTEIPEVQQESAVSWKAVGLFTVLGGSLLVALSASGFPTSYTSTSSTADIKTRLELAKKGSIMYTSLSGSEKAALFDEFKALFGKEYSSEEEEEEKFSNFKEFLKIVDSRNEDETEAGGSALHGLTKFGDLSTEEFQEGYLGFKESDDDRRRRQLKAKKAKVQKYKGSETAVNWADVYTTNVKDQGYCGSCWAFSTTEQVESDAIRAGLLSTKQDLSTQQIVSCDTTNWGCSGGNTETAYEYIKSTGGLELEASYPYTSYYDVTGTCKSTSSKYKITVSEYYSISGEENMINYVLAKGPLSICVAASTWSSYTSGIVSSCDKNVDHCVQVVGVDTDNDYWIVRNSWGTDWGENGYIYLKTGQNTCYITYDPTYAAVELA